MKEKLSGYVNEELVIDFLDLLTTLPQILGPDEYFKSSTEEEIPDIGYQKLVPHMTYSLNIKRTTLQSIILLMQAGFNSFIKNDHILQEIDFALLIKSIKDNFCHLSDENGEYCIAYECSKNNISVDGYSNFKTGHNECCRNDLPCKYNDQGQCTLSEVRYNRIIQQLIDNRIIEIKDGKYIITF